MTPDAIALIDDVIGRFFAAFDNRHGRVAAMETFEALFAPTCVIASHTPLGTTICTLEQFARPRIELLSSGRLVDFHEWEIAAENEVLGALAVRRSRYSKSGQLDGQPYAGTGTKFFQLACSGGAWRIVALSWADDAAPPEAAGIDARPQTG